MSDSLRIVVLGLTITSSWGNGHATTYRGLVRELARRGHRVLFLERDKPWYASQRDCSEIPGVQIALYESLTDLQERFAEAVRTADTVIVGSYVPEGVAVGEWVLQTAEGVTAFYDIDTPVTMAKLGRGDEEYLSEELIGRYRIYLSFTGGPVLERLEEEYCSPMARALYCSFDPDLYYPEECELRWDLGYLGTYSDDRQAALEELLAGAAREWRSGRFVVAGPQYPEGVLWPENVERIEHVPPAEHRAFYSSQRFTLNVTRQDMVRTGYAPSVRLFEAAACGVPIISDYWEGLELFFLPGEEILLARNRSEMVRYLRDIPEPERRALGQRARERALAQHTAAHRARELEDYIQLAMAASVAVEG